ncbi:ABC transporter ATP-binding protein [Haloplasma contractile]|uniref:Oligopeptide transport ATP-binding protein oppD n=1 Tax=Haloplasma contractile SSD-17B TaxID=1033810 RepID=U2FKU4_9MOLU|nr:ABC transporter ATP-binding protein [Haloplasma contractile]ERJ13405.1 Oligopeptide transport ATP-binding protein oppD [Haloplasma contractile SSD-17B]
MDKNKILEVRDLTVSFTTFNGKVSAVRGVNFDLYKGETLAIVGESGSGKSVTNKVLLGILDSNGSVDEGHALFRAEYNEEDKEDEIIDLTDLKEREMQRTIRGKRIAMIFQDPMTSLNPTMTIGKQIMEGLIEHQGMSKTEAKQHAIELIDQVGIPYPKLRFKNYPHQLSGGMRQRIVIAIALSCNPDVLICDEPTTALDVTIQAQILELIKDLQKETGVSIIFITHDLGVVANVADRVAVMYAGKVVEYGLTRDIFYNPKHPYTWGLLASMPDPESKGDLYSIPGTPPNLLYPPKGDAFAYRNEHAMKIDFYKQPPMFKVTDTHYAATWLLHKDAPKVKAPIRKKIAVKESDQNG